jgi:hypothetical protein
LSGFKEYMVRRHRSADQEILLLRESRLNLAGGMLEQQWTYVLPGGRRVVRHSAVRLYLPHNLADLLAGCGFTPADIISAGVAGGCSLIAPAATLGLTALGRTHEPRAFDDEQPCGFRFEAPTVQDSAGDDHVVAGAEWELAKGRLEHSPALADVDELVSLGVAIEEVVVLLGPGEEERHVGVEKQGDPIEHGARPRREVPRAQVPAAERAPLFGRVAQLAKRPHGGDRGGRVEVIEQRGGPAEPLVPDELFGMEGALRAAKGDVTLLGDAPELVVEGHPGLSFERLGWRQPRPRVKAQRATRGPMLYSQRARTRSVISRLEGGFSPRPRV